MKMPQFENYGNYTSDNYGLHSLKFTDPAGNEFWYSYETLVAFKVNGEFHIRENVWGNTTGKHLNWINSDKRIREDQETFNANLQRLTPKEAC